MLGLSLPWLVDLSLAGETELRLVWLLALGGTSCSRHGVEDRRLLNLGILESCGDDGASLGVVDKEAFAPRKKLQRINNLCPDFNASSLRAHAL